MRLLALALVLALPQESPPDPKPTWRRSMTLVNRGDQPLPKGVQVQASGVMTARITDGGDASDVQIFHGGRPLPTWSKGSEVWFRIAASIPAGGRDSDYEARYGGGRAPRRPDEVFEFFDGFAAGPDPKKWDWDPDLGFRVGAGGLEITRIPGSRNEYAPAFLVPRLSLPGDFVFEADLRWELDPDAPVSFALRVDLARDKAPDAETRELASALAKKLEEDDIEAREQAIRGLVTLGAGAVLALEEAVRSKDPELRTRAAKVLSHILEAEAPPAIRTGLSAGEDPGRNLDRVDLLGRSRSVLRRAWPRQAEATISIARAADGDTLLPWTRRRAVRVDGKAERVRIDFWSATGGSDAMIRISRVVVRRYVEVMPTVEFGAEEAVR